MKKTIPYRMSPLKMLALGIISMAIPMLPAHAALTFTGVSAGDASNTEVILWTRAVDSAVPANASLTVNLSNSGTIGISGSLGTLGSIVATGSGSTDSTKDYSCKLDLTGLTAGTTYYYQFVGPSGELSAVGRFKTVPAATSNYPLHFAFSGDMDGLIRPYAMASQLPNENLDFYLNCGDVIYENASTSTGSINDSASTLNFPSTTWKNSPSVTLSGAAASNAPTSGSTWATHVQLFNDYSKKYREQFLPVNTGGQSCLKDFYAGQGNYTLYDNHELGNRQYINGGAPAGGPVGGVNGNDMPTGQGVNSFGTNPGDNSNDAGDLLSLSGTGWMNRSQGFQTLQQVYLNSMAVKETRAPGMSGLISAPNDARSDSTRQLYFSQQWGRHALYIHTDTRTYRDIRMKTSNGSADDCGPRANNASRTYLGATQVIWLEQTLLAAQQAGIPWKFVALSDPIDQIGPISLTSGIGVLSGVTATTMQPYSGNSSYGPVNSDGGKSYIGGYRAERNALLKFIADHQIRNVVFLATDDHQNRINEVTYSPTSQLSTQSSYVKVPYCFSIVCGPLGATGPDLFLNHDWSSIQNSANLISNAQSAAGIEPIGLVGYPGLHDVKRDQNGTLVNESSPQPADFYSPDTFNYNVFDITPDGKTLTVTSKGIKSTAQNSALEYDAINNPAHTILSFQIDQAGPFSSIDHIIVVYQENWSFDSLYGSFPGANGRANASAASLNQLDRLSGNSLSSSVGNFNIATRTSPTLTGSNPLPIDTNNGNIADARFSGVTNTLLPYNVANYVTLSASTGDIVHRYWTEMFQIAGADTSLVDHVNNSGFVTWSDNPGLVMSYFDASNMPEGLLAQQYTMCDNFFHSAFGGSFLNHQFFIAAAPPVYPSMPTSNNGNIAYLEGTGLFAVNASGSSAGKVIRDGSITPVAGDSLTGLTINGVSGLSATVGTSGTPSDIVFHDGSHFTKHYVVNTTYSANLCPTTATYGASSLMPSLNNTNPGGVEYTQNIGDLLDNAGVSWKWYSGGWNNALDSSKSNPLHIGTAGSTVSSLFQWHHQAFAYFEKSKPFDGAQLDGRNPYATAHLQDEINLYTDITNNTLPSVSFVKFLGPDNEHPGYASLQQGQQHVADLVAAVKANPAIWAHTAIIITYDEHGGRWDHVTPPSRDIWGPGVRVPTILISPLAKRGYVDHTQRDTSSILATIEHRFGLPPLNQRDASASSLFDLFTDVAIDRGGFVFNRALNKVVQIVTITNNGKVPLTGPIQLVINNLSNNTTLSNSAGTTINNNSGSKYVIVQTGDLAVGASTTVTLQFTRPATGNITYNAFIGSGTSNP